MVLKFVILVEFLRLYFLFDEKIKYYKYQSNPYRRGDNKKRFEFILVIKNFV
jgi:hypothetical protein